MCFDIFFMASIGTNFCRFGFGCHKNNGVNEIDYVINLFNFFTKMHCKNWASAYCSAIKKIGGVLLIHCASMAYYVSIGLHINVFFFVCAFGRAFRTVFNHVVV